MHSININNNCYPVVKYIILKLAILNHKYFYFWYFKYILILIGLYFYLSKIWNVRVLLTVFVYSVVLLLSLNI